MNKLSRRVAVAAVLAALAVPLRAEIIEQVLVKVNGDIITKTELEIQADRRDPAAYEPGRQPRVVEEQRRAEESRGRGDAADSRRGDRRDADGPARQGARLQAPRRAVPRVAQRPPQGAEPRRRRQVPGGAEAGRHDDRRSAQERRTAVHDLAGAARRGRVEADHHRRGSAPVLRLTSAGVRHAGERDAPRNPRRDADGDTGRPGRRQRGAGRRNASEGDCDPRPHPGGRGFRQGGGGGVVGALQVDRRIDRPDQRQRAVRVRCRTC